MSQLMKELMFRSEAYVTAYERADVSSEAYVTAYARAYVTAYTYAYGARLDIDGMPLTRSCVT
jgi:hypothetical protein